MENIRQLEIIAETSEDDNEAMKAMDKLREIDKTYHWCFEWDGMVICKSHREFECCHCLEERNTVE